MRNTNKRNMEEVRENEILVKVQKNMKEIWGFFFVFFFFGISCLMGYLPNSKGLQGMNDIDEG